MKFLISEEEKSRILGMHQNATSRQYLSESYNDFGANIPDGPNAYKYFIGLANKTNKLDVGTAWLGKTTYWVVTKPWRAETAMQLEGGFVANLTMRGIVKRGNYFDVSNNNESITSLKLTKDKGGDTNLFIESGDQVDFWIPSTQTLRVVDSGTPGGNMSLVGGLANFKSMVKNNPNKAVLLGNFNKARKANPKFGVGIIPADQQDLYPPAQ